MSGAVIRTRAPGRISYGGGGTDVPPFDKEKGGMIINATINKYVHITLKERNDKRIILNNEGIIENYENINGIKSDNLINVTIKECNPNYGFDIIIHSDVEKQSGLGMSGSLSVAIIKALKHTEHMTRKEVAEMAVRIETEILKNKGGRQDQYAAAYGGLNQLEFNGDDFVIVSELELSKNIVLELENRTMLFTAGKRTASGDMQGALIKTFEKQKKEDKKTSLEDIKELAIKQKEALIKGDFEIFGKLMHEYWEKKKEANPSSTNEYIDRLYETAIKYGAIGGKIVGAGGGGHLQLIVNPEKKKQLIEKMKELGSENVPINFVKEGVQIWKTK